MPITKIADVGAIGMVFDATPQDLPPNAWSNASNIRFRDGSAERFLGQTQVFTAPAITPYYICPYQTTTSKYWIHAGTAAVYADDGTSRTNITGTAPTGAYTDRWSGGTLGGVLVMNNGVDVPTYWGGTGTLASLTGWTGTWRAQSIRPFKNFLIAMSITKGAVKYPHMVKWSHEADPGTIPVSWDETDPTKDAGEQDLAETSDLLVDGLAMGSSFIVYKQRSMYSMTYAGQPFIWNFQRLPGNDGAMARGCIADTPKGHVVLTSGDVVVHQGQGTQSILTAKMRRWLFTQMDSTNFANSFVTTNPWRNEVWVCFPEAGQTACTLALVWNWVDNTFGTRTLNNVTYGAEGQIAYSSLSDWSDTDTWDADTSTWNQDEFAAAQARLLICSTTPVISAVDIGSTYNGTAITATLERKHLDFGDPADVKTVRAIYPRIDGTNGTVISVEVGASMDTNTDPTYSAAQSYTIGSTYKIDTFATGRYISVRYSSTSAQPWRMRSYDVDLSARSKF